MQAENKKGCNGKTINSQLSLQSYKDNSKQAIDQLKSLYLAANREKYPNLPDYARSMPAYSDRNTKGLTRCITDYVKLKGYHIERTGCEGRVIDNRITYTDVIGNVKTIGSVQRVYSSSQRGTSDLKAIINGRFIAIEVKCKYTRDRQSTYQKEYQKQVEQSGGIYFIAETFGQFYDWFNEMIEGVNHGK